MFAVPLSTGMTPATVLLVPSFLLARDLAWLNTCFPQIIPNLAGVFGVFLARQFIVGIPDGLIETAKLDGCTELSIFAHIIMPLSKSPLATLGMFAFLAPWNSFLGPLIMLRDEHLFTLRLVMALLQGRFTGNENVQMAGAVISIVSGLVISFVFQRLIVESLANLGLKE